MEKETCTIDDIYTRILLRRVKKGLDIQTKFKNTLNISLPEPEPDPGWMVSPVLLGSGRIDPGPCDITSKETKICFQDHTLAPFIDVKNPPSFNTHVLGEFPDPPEHPPLPHSESCPAPRQRIAAPCDRP